ncbi:hypothetical protein [Methanosarcina sp.]|jgi:hypothetical protein|uniref:hypothetical protein n=1 Tax=Methanosarcina sp. TaxID=2213 RepID=UPI002B544466|nr:hypothetical protein [Methanosarcina sp.]HOW15986.1 hypothetical protein [Methanosarcina sp.]
MRLQKVPEPEKRRFYSSTVYTAAYKQELNPSSQSFLFRYSIIEASPVKGSTSAYGSIEYTDINTDSRCSDLPAKTDLTMEDHDTYLKYMEKLSESSEIQHLAKNIVP